MAEQSHYEAVGGKPVIAQAMQDLFANRILGDATAEPPLASYFGDRLTNPKLREPHQRSVGWFIGALLGGQGHERVSVELIASNHPDRFPGDVFDAVIGHTVEALTQAAETAGTGTAMQEAIASIVPAVNALRPLMVTEQLPPHTN